MKRIALVLAGPPTLSETFISSEMHALVACGHEVLPIIIRRRALTPIELAHPVVAERALYLDEVSPVEALRALARSGRPLSAAARFAAHSSGSAKSLIWNAAKIAALARAHGCTHFHAHFAWSAASHAIAAAKMNGATCSMVAHAADIYLSPEDLSLKLRNADFTVAVCADALSDMARLCPQARLHLVPCGVDTDRFQPPGEPGPSNGKLLFIGRLDQKKGVAELFDALGIIQASRRPAIDIVGDGPEAEALKSKALNYGLQCSVSFLGPKPSAWIAANALHYQALVAPFRIACNGDRDASPTVIKEAMAMGLPVVATRIMGVEEIMGADGGFLLPEEDPLALARAVEAASRLTIGERAALGVRARARICAGFSSLKQGRKLSSLVEGTTAVHKGGPHG